MRVRTPPSQVIASETNVNYNRHRNHWATTTSPPWGFAMCLNQTYSCATVQFIVPKWHYNALVIREFKLHPDATSAVPPGHPFPPSSRVLASDPSN